MARRRSLLLVLLIALVVPATARAAAGVELSGFAGIEARLFPESPKYDGQRDQDGSLVLQPEWYYDAGDGLSVSFTPFARLDSADQERTHADIRELQVWLVREKWECRAGIGKVFWGATEFVHLVDIINQTDAVEDIDGEDKLGQPMVQLSVPGDFGVFDLFLLPYFRERTFPGRHGRMRYGLEVDADHPLYESAAAQHHFDYALRYSTTIRDADLGLYYFAGTGREPTLLPRFSANQGYLVPYYVQIHQVGFDMQAALGNTLVKLEALHRDGQGESFWAGTGGFEYTFYGIAGSLADLGLLLEGAYDERRDLATTFAENELMLGVRYSANDQAGSTLLVGWLQDLDSTSRLIRLEGSRRLTDHWKVLLEGDFFLNIDARDLLYSLEKDDLVRLELRYYF